MQALFNHTKTEDEVLTDTINASGHAIILYNDDVNTFDWVIYCLTKYCDHTIEQAEQCAWLVHTKGKCIVKMGIKEELVPICNALCEAGLSAVLTQST